MTSVPNFSTLRPFWKFHVCNRWGFFDPHRSTTWPIDPISELGSSLDQINNSTKFGRNPSTPSRVIVRQTDRQTDRRGGYISPDSG